MLAVDVPPAVFELMAKNEQWLTDDEAWKGITSGFHAQHIGYANQIRESAIRRKAEGASFLLLFAVKEEKVALLNL